ncbi:MAG: phage terminase large subunit family protein [Nitrosopumilus sp.]
MSEAKNKYQITLSALIANKIKKYPRLFMGMVHHKTTKGAPLTFADKPWLIEIYKDDNPNIVGMKCSQVHWTEQALCAMYTYAKQGLRGMYILPSKEHRRTFVADRINKMRDYSELYRRSIKETTVSSDSNVIKTLFGQSWKFVGSNVKNDFYEFPCDVLLFDEYDRLKQENIPYAFDRIANSKNKVVWKFGNPTRPGFGIHAEWLASDAKIWQVKCDCGHWEELDWYKHFVIKNESSNNWELRNEDAYPICLECKKPFSRLGKGRWFKTNPDSKVSGYKVSRLFVFKEVHDIQNLFHQFLKSQHDQSSLQNFHNNYLAEPYENADFKITDELLLASAKRRIQLPKEQPRCIMGVDQGRLFTCYISTVVNGKLVDLQYINVIRWEDVDALEEAYNVICTVIDAQGGGYVETRDFVKASKRAQRLMCYYRSKDKVKTLYNIDYKTNVVEVNRTEMADVMVKELITEVMVRPDWESIDNGEFAKQMKFPARLIDPDKERPIWTKGNDHYFHAAIYRQVAKIVSGMHNGYNTTAQSWFAHNPNRINPNKIISDIPTIIGEEIMIKNDTSIKKRSWSVSNESCN